MNSQNVISFDKRVTDSTCHDNNSLRILRVANDCLDVKTCHRTRTSRIAQCLSDWHRCDLSSDFGHNCLLSHGCLIEASKHLPDDFAALSPIKWSTLEI